MRGIGHLVDLDDVRSALGNVGSNQAHAPRVATLVEALRAELTWEPQDFQLPPPGDWWLWVFSGGAGCGKTDTGSWWMNEHMMGPPCSHTVPGGHKALIAGPTFADAVTTCWGPPSGIRSHNRDAQIVTRKDGTRIIWPNGAEALVAGLHTEKDADLLRARAANACLPAGTLVETSRGRVPIERVRRGDRVRTRRGWRPVRWAGFTGVKELWHVEAADGSVLVATGDHEVWTELGWQRVDALDPSTSSIARCVMPAKTSPDTAGIAGLTAVTETGDEDYGPASSGSWNTDRFQTGTRSTTSTVTRATTSRRTSSRSRSLNITPHIHAIAPGTWPGGEHPGPHDQQSSDDATSVVGVSQRAARGRCAVDGAVNAFGPGPARDGRCSTEHASSAASSSGRGRPSMPEPALVRVRSVSRTGRAAMVFDLTVADAHEFYADGFLVHNCCWWIDEAALATHLQLALDLIQQRARLGANPHGIVTSTPRPTPGWKYMLRLPEVVQSRASSYDNKYLSDRHKARLERFRGTRLERQEIYGELIDEYEGALWTAESIDSHRILDFPKDIDERLNALGIVRVGVGIDPSTWIPDMGGPDVAQDYESGEGVETGLVVAGIDRRNPPHVYVLDDLSARMAATEWARRAAAAFHRWHAAWVVPETNAGGDMVLATIQLTDPTVTIYHEPGTKKAGVRAAVGKRARAEPVAALWEQGRGHMVGEFPALEATLKQWDPTFNWSPDRLDGMVWPITALRPWKPRGRAGAGLATGAITRPL